MLALVGGWRRVRPLAAIALGACAATTPGCVSHPAAVGSTVVHDEPVPAVGDLPASEVEHRESIASDPTEPDLVEPPPLGPGDFDGEPTSFGRLSLRTLRRCVELERDERRERIECETMRAIAVGGRVVGVLPLRLELRVRSFWSLTSTPEVVRRDRPDRCWRDDSGRFEWRHRDHGRCVEIHHAVRRHQNRASCFGPPTCAGSGRIVDTFGAVPDRVPDPSTWWTLPPADLRGAWLATEEGWRRVPSCEVAEER